MPRARLSMAGPVIALPGYDVDTAPTRKLAFSPEMPALRLAEEGTTTIGELSGGGFNNMYYWASVAFEKAYMAPPLVMVAGLNDDGSTDQSCFHVGYTTGGGTENYQRPFMEVRVFVDHFELYVLVRNGPRTDVNPLVPRATNWRYFVFQNTLED